MQKKLLTMAVAGALAVPAVAFAQVTVYGTIDTGIRNISKLATPTKAPAGTQTDSVLDVANNTRTTNRLGFKGSEDLGGGLMANFTMEGQHDSDTGARTLNFARKTIVGLSKGGNSVDLGRDYTVNFKSQGIYDPMSYTYTGITPSAGTNVAGTRSNNLVTAGFRFGTGGVRVDYAAGEVLDTTTPSPQKEDRIGFMADFAFGPATVTGAYSTVESTVQTVPTDVNTMNFGGAYTMGALTFRAGWSQTEYKATDGSGDKVKTPMLLLGVQYAISPTLNGRFGYYDVNAKASSPGFADLEFKTKTFIVAMDYALSKRTILYVEFDRITLNDNVNSEVLAGTATATFAGFNGIGSGNRTDGSTGIGVGIMHAF